MGQPFVISMKAYLDAQGVALGTEEAERHLADLNRRATAEIAKIEATGKRVGKAVGAAGYQMRNLQYQMIDIAQGIPLAFQSPTYAMLNFANQGAQIAQTFGPEEGGAARAFKEAGLMAGRFLIKLAPVAGIVGLSAAALAGFTHEIDKTTAKSVNMGDVILASFQVIGTGVYDAYFKPVADSAEELWDIIWGGAIWITKTLVNSVVVTVGTMSGSVEYAILGLWILLKGTAGNVQNFFADALQSVTDLITGGINSAIEGVNGFIRNIGADKAAAMFDLPGQIDLVGKADFSGFRSTLADEAEAEFEALNKTYGDFFDKLTTEDHAGTFFTAVRNQVVENLSKPTEEELKAAEKLRQAYAKIKLGVDRKIASLKLEAQALGMTELEANKLRFAQLLLNQAYDAGIEVTAEKEAELRARADLWAEETDQLRRLSEAYDFGKSSFRSFFAELNSELMNGASLWVAFGNAAINVIGKITDRALEAAADGIWDMVWGGLRSGVSSGRPINLMAGSGGLFGGAIIPGILHGGGTAGIDGYGHGKSYPLSAWANAPRFHNGTLFATNEFPAILEYGERVIPANQNRMQAANANQPIQNIYAPVNNFPRGSTPDDWDRFADRDRRAFGRMVAGSSVENHRRGRTG